jgi:hypothetical protein
MVHVSKSKQRAGRATAVTHRNKVHLVGTPERSAHIQTPADPEPEEDGDVDVRCEEVL